VEVWCHTFVTSAESGDEWSASRPGRLNPGKYTGIHWTEGSVGPRAGLFFPQSKKPLFTHTGKKTVLYIILGVLESERDVKFSK